MASERIRHFHLWLAAIVALGLTLRILAGVSGLWMDEAWSVIFARAAGDPLGVFFRLNHDNNHHLNTLWLQLVGMRAPPLAMRAPAILCSTIAIAVAARLARRDGDVTALVTASLLAASPFFVLYGSEARGYALVTLAILLLLAETRDWLETGNGRRGWMAVIAGLGCFSHLVMLPALGLIAGWAWVARGGLKAPLRAARDVGNALDLALITGLTCGAFIIGGAKLLGGMAVGSYNPFAGRDIIDGLAGMAGLTLGFDDIGLNAVAVVAAIATIALASAVIPPAPKAAQRWLWLGLIAAMPLGVVLLQLGNSQFGRYYILSAIGLLLLLGNRLGALLTHRSSLRLAGMAVAGAIAVLFGVRDAILISDARAQPDRPVDIIAARMPHGASILITLWRSSAPLEVAAAQRRYPLRIVGPDCAPAEYLHWPYLTRASVQPTLDHCGLRWQLIAQRDALPPSQENWALYRRAGSAGPSLSRRAGLPPPGAVASGPRPAL
ncbi:MAG: glycosyltransferase family 39 protein [Sphingomicrobium sp.]